MKVLEEGDMDTVIANRVKELRLGIGGNRHTYRAIAIKVVGIEDQHLGSTICQTAERILSEDWGDRG